MELQEIFDKAVLGVLTQQTQCKDGHACALRSDDGKSKCAVGWLIPDEDYHADLELESDLSSYTYEDDQMNDDFVETNLSTALEKQIGEITQEKFSLLLDLQTAHDEDIFIGEIGNFTHIMADRFIRVASNHGLSEEVIFKFMETHE